MTSPLKVLLAAAALAGVASCSTQADDLDLADVVAVEANRASLYTSPLVSGDLSPDDPYDLWFFNAPRGFRGVVRAKSPSNDLLFAQVYEVRGRRAFLLAKGECSLDEDEFSPVDTVCTEFTTRRRGQHVLLITTAAYEVGGRDLTASYTLRIDEAQEQEEEILCGGFTTEGPLECPAGMYCEYEPEDVCGAADAPGVCKDIPDEICPQVVIPVCACGTDEIFTNECFARAAGFSPYSCPVCSSDAECGSGEICDLSGNLSCSPVNLGQCRVDDQRFCTREYQPVCGCDGQTYGNDCERRAAGAALAFAGECGGDEEPPFPPQGQACSVDGDCASGEICDLSANDSCGPGLEGECLQVGSVSCPAPDENSVYECGCDGEPYANPCLRRFTGVALDPSLVAKPGDNGEIVCVEPQR